MTDEQFCSAGFSFTYERDQWKIIKFDWNNYKAIRSCGKVNEFTSADDADHFILGECAKNCVKYYIDTTARAMAKTTN